MREMSQEKEGLGKSPSVDRQDSPCCSEWSPLEVPQVSLFGKSHSGLWTCI